MARGQGLHFKYTKRKIIDRGGFKVKILVADLGGTKARLAWSDAELGLSEITDYSAKEYSDFQSVLDAFFAKTGRIPDMIAVGVAGPVLDGKVHMPNLGWHLDQRVLASNNKTEKIFFLNDLEAFAWGVGTVASPRIIKSGTFRSGNKAVIASGTGLGMAVIHSFNGLEIPFATEGGHTTFAPRLGDEGLWKMISQKYDGHASWERVVSGKFGFANLLEFLKPNFSHVDFLPFASAEGEEVGALITSAARRGNPLALAVMERFCYYYGAEAANLALKSFAVGGIYVAGGIAAKISDFILEKPWFLEGFLNKGRYRDFVEPIPVFLIEDELCALRGSAKRALFNGFA